MLATTKELIIEFQQGNMVILVDDEDRENEGDLVLPAAYANAAAINFMVTHARGLVCLALTEERCQHLQLPLMTSNNGTSFQTAFTISIEAAKGVTTGISAADRARTIQVAIDSQSSANDLVSPGHIFPLKAKKNGVLERPGHTEASCDLAAAAGLNSAAVICEIMNEDGSMARLPELLKFGESHGLKVGAIKDIISHRLANETLVSCVQSGVSNTIYGEALFFIYRCNINHALFDVWILGKPEKSLEAIVSIHEIEQTINYLELRTNKNDLTIHRAFEHITQAKPNCCCGILIVCNQLNYASHFHNDQNNKKDPASFNRLDQMANTIYSQILIDLNIKKIALLRPNAIKLSHSSFESVRSINI